MEESLAISAARVGLHAVAWAPGPSGLNSPWSHLTSLATTSTGSAGWSWQFRVTAGTDAAVDTASWLEQTGTGPDPTLGQAISIPESSGLPVLAGAASSSRATAALDDALGQVRRSIEDSSSLEQQTLAGTLVLSSSLSVGYLLWLVRGGALLASLASTIPAWASLDPLPVLSRFRTRRPTNEAEGGSAGPSGSDTPAQARDGVEQMFSRARPELPRGNAHSAGAARDAEPSSAQKPETDGTAAAVDRTPLTEPRPPKASTP